MPDAPRTQLAELKIPAQGAFIGLAKRVATSLGSQLGFGLDEIDELSIAVVQACSSTIEAADDMWGAGATLKLSFGATDRAFMVDVEAVAPRSQEALPTRRPAAARVENAELEMQRALARDMIRLFVDDFRHQVDTGRRQIHYRMVKYLIS
jgi:hypothetical protein